MSSVPNLHIRRNLNITGRKANITKRKTLSFISLKGLLNKYIFNSLIFHFILVRLKISDMYVICRLGGKYGEKL